MKKLLFSLILAGILTTTGLLGANQSTDLNASDHAGIRDSIQLTEAAYTTQLFRSDHAIIPD